MRLIIPLILIALMLPYATRDDSPSGEWLVPPDPTMGGEPVAVVAAAPAAPAKSSDIQAATQPATQPAIAPRRACRPAP